MTVRQDFSQQLPRRGVVVDDQNREAGEIQRRQPTLRLVVMRVRVGDGLHRQEDTKRRTLADAFALCADVSAVQFHQVLDDGQTESQAAVRACEGLVGLPEPVEDER